VLRFFGNLLRLLLAPLWLYARLAMRRRARWVELRLSPRLTQFRPRDNWVRRLTARARDTSSTSLEELRALAHELTRDPGPVGVLVYVPPLEAGWSACESVRDTLVRLREAGKQVVCYLPEGGGNRELYVASAGTRIYMAPYSSFGPLGLASRPLYLRPLLDRIGVAVQAQSCGEYKSAAEPALRDTMSEPAREQLEALLSAMHGALVDGLRVQRGLSEERVKQLFDAAILLAEDALALGVVDGVVYESDVKDQLDPGAPDGKESTKKKRKSKPIAASAYTRMRRSRLWQPLRRQPGIALVSVHGTIVGDQGGRFSSGIRTGNLTPLLRQLKSDARVRAVVLHIDSPGGSALASEQLHHEIATLAAEKPVIACFGDVAASGGYYLASACHKIVAPALTITGSIGVVSAKVTAGSLLERIGVRPQLVRTTESADMLSFARGLTEREEALMRAHADQLYRRFLQVVAEGRHATVDVVEPLARGRVWIGSAARERGLIDVVGGIERALDEARALIKDLPDAARARLKPELYILKTSPVAGLTGAAAALLQTFAPELALLDLGRRELGWYYAPWLAESQPFG
jgi:protease-4